MAQSNNKPMGRPPRGVRGVGPRVENPGKLLKRLMSELMKYYKIHMILVAFCIVASVLCNAQGTMFTQSLIDNYIEPMLVSGSTDFTELTRAIARVAIFYAIGVSCAFAQNRIMIYVTQGTLKRMRDKMFDHMEGLPIRYFDTHSHGDIMSHYTNDADTLREMLSKSLPQVIDSIFTIVTVFFAMMLRSLWLTLIVVVFSFFMLKMVLSIIKKYLDILL